MAQYGCVAITAGADENIVPLIFKEMTGNIPVATKCKLQFVGFEAKEGTKIKINGVPNQVPSTGNFITPYDSVNHMIINSLTFNEGCSELNVWFLY